MTDLDENMIRSLQLVKEIHLLTASLPAEVIVNSLVSTLSMIYQTASLPKDFFMLQMSNGWDLCAEARLKGTNAAK